MGMNVTQAPHGAWAEVAAYQASLAGSQPSGVARRERLIEKIEGRYDDA